MSWQGFFYTIQVNSKDLGDKFFIYTTQTIQYWESNDFRRQPSSCPVIYNVLNIATHIPSCFINSTLMVYCYVELIASRTTWWRNSSLIEQNTIRASLLLISLYHIARELELRNFLEMFFQTALQLIFGFLDGGFEILPI
jgi:hypothetical protein